MNSSIAHSACMVIALFLFGCSGTRPAPVHPSIADASAPKAIAADHDAIDAATEFLRHHHADWGPAIRVLRTGSGWYRVEYAHDTGQAERVVLVDPATGEASFPMPR